MAPFSTLIAIIVLPLPVVSLLMKSAFLASAACVIPSAKTASSIPMAPVSLPAFRIPVVYIITLILPVSNISTLMSHIGRRDSPLTVSPSLTVFPFLMIPLGLMIFSRFLTFCFLAAPSVLAILPAFRTLFSLAAPSVLAILPRFRTLFYLGIVP